MRATKARMRKARPVERRDAALARGRWCRMWDEPWMRGGELCDQRCKRMSGLLGLTTGGGAAALGCGVASGGRAAGLALTGCAGSGGDGCPFTADDSSAIATSGAITRTLSSEGPCRMEYG